MRATAACLDIAEGTFPSRRVNEESRIGFRRREAKATMLAAPSCHPPTMLANNARDTPTVVRKVSFAWPLQQVHEVNVRAHL